MPDELERMRKEILEFERIETVFDEMRDLVEQLWPELMHKLTPKKPYSLGDNAEESSAQIDRLLLHIYRFIDVFMRRCVSGLALHRRGGERDDSRDDAAKSIGACGGGRPMSAM